LLITYNSRLRLCEWNEQILISNPSFWNSTL